MATWNHLYTDGDDLTALDVVNMYVAAMHERFLIFGLVALRVAGDDATVASFWNQMQFKSDGSLIAADGPVIPSEWVIAQDFTGMADFTYIDYAYVRDTALGGNGYTRKYPREFSTLSSTTYTDGASFSNGDSARCLADGKVRTRAAGAWTLASSGTYPDIVSTFGNIQAGDIFGPWILNEIRDALNLFLAIVTVGELRPDFSPPFNGVRLGWSSDGSVNFTGNSAAFFQPTWADAQTQAEGSFDLTDTVELKAPTKATYGINYGSTSDFVATAVSVSGKMVGIDTVRPGFTPRLEFYSLASPAINGNDSIVGNYDDNGDAGILNGLLCQFDSETGGATGTSFVGSIVLGSLAFPNWGGDPSSGGVANGYITDVNARIVWRYDVAGGFVYQPLTFLGLSEADYLELPETNYLSLVET